MRGNKNCFHCSIRSAKEARTAFMSAFLARTAVRKQSRKAGWLSQARWASSVFVNSLNVHKFVSQIAALLVGLPIQFKVKLCPLSLSPETIAQFCCFMQKAFLRSLRSRPYRNRNNKKLLSVAFCLSQFLRIAIIQKGVLDLNEGEIAECLLACRLITIKRSSY